MSWLYDASIPSMLQYLGSLKRILKKGEDFCNQRGGNAKALLRSRLHFSMGDLIFNVQMCTNGAKLLAARIGKLECEAIPDDDASFEQLYARIDKVTEILKKVEPASMNRDKSEEIHVKTLLTSFTLGAIDYVTLYAVPNFHFHITTTYAILRSQGVELSKLDYAPFETDPSGRLQRS